MKTLLLCSLLWALPGGDRDEGLAHFAAGRYAEAAASFRRAIDSEGDSAELHYNLALASWRSGDLAAAEIAAEKYAALAGAVRPELHRGLLGAVRYDEAKALAAKAEALGTGAGAPPAAPGEPGAAPPDPLPLLEQALAKTNQAKEHFVRGAVAGASPELVRNTERALGLAAELERRIEELKKQREQEPSDERKDQEKSDEKKDDKEKDEKDEKGEKGEKGEQKPPDEQEQSEQKEQPEGQPKPDEPKPGEGAEQPPEPQQGEHKNQPEGGQEQQPGEQQPEPEPQPAEPRNDAPGEGAEGRELSPEQAQRLLEQVKDLDQKLQQLRVMGRAPRKKVERDW
jgi:hypothetical protein